MYQQLCRTISSQQLLVTAIKTMGTGLLYFMPNFSSMQVMGTAKVVKYI
jgi:hypothetical protein